MSKAFISTKGETLPNVLNRRGCEEYTKKGSDNMVQIIYTIVKNNELILAQNLQYSSKAEAQKQLKALYEDIKTKTNIKDITHNSTQLVFTDTAENDSDETHKFEIIGGE